MAILSLIATVVITIVAIKTAASFVKGMGVILCVLMGLFLAIQTIGCGSMRERREKRQEQRQEKFDDWKEQRQDRERRFRFLRENDNG